MGTGVGEAMLIGAVTGAGTSAITGGDPLKGALFGAAGGAIMPGISSAFGGAPATAAATSASTIAPGAAGNVGMGMSGFGNTIGSAVAPTTTGTLGGFGQVGAGGFGNAMLPSAVDIAGAGSAVMPTATSVMAPTTVAAPAASSSGFSNLPSAGDLLSRDRDTTSRVGSRVAELINKYPIGAPAAGGAFSSMLFNRPEVEMPGDDYDSPLKRFRYSPDTYRPSFAEGGITDLDIGTRAQLSPSPVTMMASGGISDLGGYSDGGRLLKGPGDGMSDSIPARIGRRQPARLADGEFVVPADVVSHLGNGSTDAGAKKLYDMMDKVRRARTGNKKQGKEINPRKYMPA